MLGPIWGQFDQKILIHILDSYYSKDSRKLQAFIYALQPKQLNK